MVWAGEPARLVSMQDITSHTNIKNELYIEQERFRTLIDFTYDWEYWLLPDQKLVYISPSCKRITGYEAAEFIEQPHLLETIVYDEDIELYLAHVKDAFSEEQSAALDFRIVTKEGQVRWIGHRCQPVYNEEGIYIGRRISNREITDQKTFEEELRASEIKFRRFVNHSKDGIYIISTKGQIIEWNPRQEEITGLVRADTIGKQFWQVQQAYITKNEQTRVDFDEGKQAIQRALKKGSNPWTKTVHEFEIVSKNNQIRVIQEHYFTIKTLSGYQIGCITRDITDKKNVENALYKLTEELEKRVEERTSQLKEEISVRKKVEDEIKSRLENEKKLAEISEIFLRIKNIRRAMPKVLGVLGDLTRATRILLFNLSDSGTQVDHIYEWNKEGPIWRVNTKDLVLTDYFTTWIDKIQSGEIINIAKVNEMPPEIQGMLTPALSERTESLLFIPLLSRGNLIGLISIENVQNTLFTEEEGTSLLEVFARLTVSTLEREYILNTLEKRVRDRTRDLQMLYEIAAITSKPTGVKKILENTLDIVVQAIYGKAGFIHIIDSTGSAFRLTEKINISPENARVIDTLVWDDGLLDRFFATKDPLFIPSLQIDSVKPLNVFKDEFPGYIGVPIRVKGQLFGLISILGKSFESMTLEHVALLSSVADQLAVAIETARLRDKAEDAAVMKERQRLARELHDSVTQYLYSIPLLTKGWQRMVDNATKDEVKSWLGHIGNISTQMLKEMRLLLYDLRPLALEQDGLIGAIKRRLETLESRFEVKTVLEVDENINVPTRIEQELYRIIQEAINNTVKHAEADRVIVRLRQAREYLELEIEDNGIGFDPITSESGDGIGLSSMRERAKSIGGTLILYSLPSQGSRINVRIKLQPKINEGDL